jgi:hypothetical protein
LASDASCVWRDEPRRLWRDTSPFSPDPMLTKPLPKPCSRLLRQRGVTIKTFPSDAALVLDGRQGNSILATIPVNSRIAATQAFDGISGLETKATADIVNLGTIGDFKENSFAVDRTAAVEPAVPNHNLISSRDCVLETRMAGA